LGPLTGAEVSEPAGDATIAAGAADSDAAVAAAAADADAERQDVHISWPSVLCILPNKVFHERRHV